MLPEKGEASSISAPRTDRISIGLEIDSSRIIELSRGSGSAAGVLDGLGSRAISRAAARFDPIPADGCPFPPTNSRGRRGNSSQPEQAAAHGKVHYRSSISHSALRPRERGSPVLSSQTLHSRAPVRLHRGRVAFA